MVCPRIVHLNQILLSCGPGVAREEPAAGMVTTSMHYVSRAVKHDVSALYWKTGGKISVLRTGLTYHENRQMSIKLHYIDFHTCTVMSCWSKPSLSGAHRPPLWWWPLPCVHVGLQWKRRLQRRVRWGSNNVWWVYGGTGGERVWAMHARQCYIVRAGALSHSGFLSLNANFYVCMLREP